jgi:hypothetical protein
LPLAATNGGGITVTGKGTQATGGGGINSDGIDLNFTEILSTGGPITLNGSGGTYGISLGGRAEPNNLVTIGQKAVPVNSVSMAASTSNIALNADSLLVNSGASSGWAGNTPCQSPIAAPNWASTTATSPTNSVNPSKPSTPTEMHTTSS